MFTIISIYIISCLQLRNVYTNLSLINSSVQIFLKTSTSLQQLSEAATLGVPSKKLLLTILPLFCLHALIQTLSSGQQPVKTCQNLYIRTNNPCCNIIPWKSVCFPQFNQQKHVGIISINNV